MTIRKPDINEYFSYIIQTHQADHINLTLPEIKKTLAKAKGDLSFGKRGEEVMASPFAEGHFKAINYAEKLAASPDFPAKDLNLISNEYQSHTALFWLREMHTHMMYPIAQFGQVNRTGSLYIQPSQCGTYRYEPLMLAFKPAPHPDLIPKLLHLWLRDITQIDLEVRDKVQNPYAFTPEQGAQLFKKVKEANLFLSCLCPFTDGNNRIAKLVENTLRMRWMLPWRTIYGVENDTHIRELAHYADYELINWLKKLEKP